jgi:hypothetical protein
MSHEGEHGGDSLNRLAFSATVHCLTGCGIGEVLGLMIGTALGWDDLASIALAIVLAFFFGYSLTLRPLLGAGIALVAALRLAFAADTLSITVMEIVDNAVVLAVPARWTPDSPARCSGEASRSRWPRHSSPRTR